LDGATCPDTIAFSAASAASSSWPEVAHIHEWRAGDLLIVDNHRMLHSRAPFVGLRHVLRVRYDDPLHQTVSLDA
jgi:alpha-ketoglutarate-dependent taurine dioxygenase